MRAWSWVFPFLILFLAVACRTGAPGTTPIRTSQSSISLQELESVPGVTAHQAVERLRPRWLQGRVATIRGQSGQRVYPQVLVDGIPYGDLEALKRMNANDIREIRFLSASDATTRYGTGYPGGIIHVLTRQGGGG